MAIEFTHYMLPEGRHCPCSVKRPPEIEAAAKEITDAGMDFEAEILTTGAVSLTVADPREGVDIAIQLCGNGPEVLAAVDQLVRDAIQFIHTDTSKEESDGE